MQVIVVCIVKHEPAQSAVLYQAGIPSVIHVILDARGRKIVLREPDRPGSADAPVLARIFLCIGIAVILVAVIGFLAILIDF